MPTLSLEEFTQKASNGQIFTIEFVKRTDGELRRMNCRRGVSKGVKGVGMSYDPRAKNLLPVFDMQKGAFRSVNLSNLISLRMDNKVYRWDNENGVFVEA